MKWGWLLWIGLAGCASSSRVAPHIVSYHVIAPCGDVPGALLEMRDQLGVREFILVESRLGGRCGCIHWAGRFPIESREQVGKLLAFDEQKKRWAEVEVKGRRFELMGGNISTSSLKEEAGTLVAETDRVLRIVRSGPPHWKMCISGSQVVGPRLLHYFCRLGVGRVWKSGAPAEHVPVEQALERQDVSFQGRLGGISIQYGCPGRGEDFYGMLTLETGRGEDLFRLWDAWADVLSEP